MGHSLFCSAVVTLIVRARLPGLDECLGGGCRRPRRHAGAGVPPDHAAPHGPGPARRRPAGLHVQPRQHDRLDSSSAWPGNDPFPCTSSPRCAQVIKPDVGAAATLMLLLTLFALGAGGVRAPKGRRDGRRRRRHAHRQLSRADSLAGPCQVAALRASLSSPNSAPAWMSDAITDGGGLVSPLAEAKALVWGAPAKPAALGRRARASPGPRVDPAALGRRRALHPPDRRRPHLDVRERRVRGARRRARAHARAGGIARVSHLRQGVALGGAVRHELAGRAGHDPRRRWHHRGAAVVAGTVRLPRDCRAQPRRRTGRRRRGARERPPPRHVARRRPRRRGPRPHPRHRRDHRRRRATTHGASRVARERRPGSSRRHR